MTDVKRLLAEATPLPWIRPWGSLQVHAVGSDDVFGRLVPHEYHPGSEQAQANIDFAVHAVNYLPDYEVAVDALGRLVFSPLCEDFPDGGDIILRWEGNTADWENAREALRRLRGHA